MIGGYTRIIQRIMNLREAETHPIRCKVKISIARCSGACTVVNEGMPNGPGMNGIIHGTRLQHIVRDMGDCDAE